MGSASRAVSFTRTRQPLDAPYYSVETQFGSFGNYRTVLDATGPLNTDKSAALPNRHVLSAQRRARGLGRFRYMTRQD